MGKPSTISSSVSSSQSKEKPPQTYGRKSDTSLGINFLKFSNALIFIKDLNLLE